MVSAALDTVERQAEGTDFHTGQRLAAPCKKVFFIVFFQPGKNFFPIYAKIADDGEFGKGRQFYFSFLHDIAEEEGACQTGKAVDEHGAGAAFLFLTAGGVIDFFCFFSVSGKKRHAGIQFG